MKKWLSGIRAKLLMVTTITVLSLMAVGTTGYFAISSLSQRLDTAYNDRMKILEYQDFIEIGINTNVRWLWSAYALTDLKERQVFIDKAKEEIKALDEHLKVYEALPRSAKSKEVYEQKIKPNLEAGKKEITAILSFLEKADSASKEKAEELITHKLTPFYTEASEAVDELQKMTNEINNKIVEESISFAHNAKTTALLIVVISALFSFALSIYVAGSLANSLSAFSIALSRSTAEVSAASSQIASGAEELSQATSEQAASLQETSSSIEEISSMVNANTENAKQSSSISEQSLNMAEKGKVVVGHMVNAISEINASNNGIMDQINETNKEIENIVKIINEIGNKTKVINDIVFQTKLLSFNASVEAARAGEQGKGFAVVAEEVGNLAAMSGAAALEITKMLDGSIKTVEEIIKNSKEKIGKLISTGKEKVETGSRVAHECEQVLSDIVDSVASVSKMITEIASASQEQAQGVHEVTKAIGQLDQVTQQNSANSAESANAASSLSAQAVLLANIVKNLTKTIEGKNSGGTNEIAKITHSNSKSSSASSSSSHQSKTPPPAPPAKTKSLFPKKAALMASEPTKKEPISDYPKGATPSSNDKRFEDV